MAPLSTAPAAVAATGTGVRRPEPPRLAVRVGVTGHREEGLDGMDEKRLREKVREILSMVSSVAVAPLDGPRQHYAERPPILRIVSPLAEGSDRLVVEEALALGFDLQCPLPFSRAEYQADFTTASSREAFTSLLSRASAVLELDGDRANADAAYERVGRVMLWQSDLIIAIWNGDATLRRGGTAHTVMQAIAADIPVLWVEAHRPHGVRLIPKGSTGVADSRPLERLPMQVRELLLPAPNRDDPIGDRYFREAEPRFNGVGVFRRFRQVVERLGGGVNEPASMRAERNAETAPSAPIAAISPDPRAEYRWADRLADHYGAFYRDSFVANYLMGAAAVAAALLGYRSWVASLVELTLIGAIIYVTILGRRSEWHTRWLHYRILAEQLRHVELLRPLGRVLPSFRVPAHATAADPGHLWVSWLARARVRELGMVDARLTTAYVDAYRRELDERLAGQIRYHDMGSHRTEILAHTLHRTGIAMFWATAIACVLHLAFDYFEHRCHQTGRCDDAGTLLPLVNPALTFLAAVLPALGAALAGIASQGEFGRIAQRSKAMALQLQSIATRLRVGPAATSDECGLLAEQAVKMMTAELLDWQLTFRTKPLELPG